jgi:DNA-binding phage protein
MSKSHPLIAYAKKSGKTVTRIAREASCSRQTLYRVMSGEQNPTLALLVRISAATNGAVTPNDFLPRPVEQGAA